MRTVEHVPSPSEPPRIPSSSVYVKGLRRTALAVCVLDDVDLEPGDDGVVLRGTTPVAIGWAELGDALGAAEPETELARIRLRRHLRGRRIAADLTGAQLADRARPMGFPVNDPLHPGAAWVQERVLGGVLDLGLGFVGVGHDPDAVIVVPHQALQAEGCDAAAWWPEARRYVERMGALAAERLRSDASGVLRPIGDCDVVTLLGSAVLRSGLCGGEFGGMRAAAVPMRRRGWLDLTRIDPAFAMAAAAAVDDEDRAFPRPLLLTADEVVLSRAGGRPAELTLRDPAVGVADVRGVRWHPVF